MKVKELIQKLQEFDPELPVVVDGYESGFDHVTTLHKTRAFQPEDVSNKPLYDGELFCVGKDGHPAVFFLENKKIQGKTIDIVYIPRTSY